jgi:hypothetical protein
MTDKEFSQINEWLDGQRRYKLLDCNRKNLLRLKGARLQVWMAQYMSESPDQESWLSLGTLMHLTGLTKPAIIAARKWLIANGWTRDTGEVAASKYSLPSRGSHKVKVLSVDDPSKETLPPSKVVLPTKTLPNVTTAFASAVALAVSPTVENTTTRTCTPHLSPSEDPSLREDEKQQPETKTKTETTRSASEAKWLAKYGETKPAWFDEAAHTVENQLRRSAWIEAHPKLGAVPVKEKAIASASLQFKTPAVDDELESTPVVQPPSSAPPPIPPKPVEPVDHRLAWMKMLAEEIYTLQTCFNGNVKPPIDWETAWLPDMDALVKLTEGKGSLTGWMLTDVIALSQFRYATKYATPDAILADVVPLGREVAELRTQGTFEEIRDAYFEFFRSPEQPPTDDELDYEPGYVDPEVKAAQEQKERARCIVRWNTWLDANTPQERTA